MSNQNVNPLVFENTRTVANLITIIRVIACLIIFTVAYVNGSRTQNMLGLMIFWGLDILDGFLARTMKQETLLGAQIDILADRLLAALFYVNFIAFEPSRVLPSVLYLFEFMFLDTFLSIQFLNWKIISPNYFYKVDRKIWLLNWSAPAKIINSSLITGILMFTDDTVVTLSVISILIAVKSFSIVQLQRKILNNDFAGGNHV